MIQDLLRAFDEDPGALWGDPARQSDGWAGHNPYDLAPRLGDVRLFVSVGNGEPGPLDGQAIDRQAQQIERTIYPQNLAFVQRLSELGIPARFDAYGPGTCLVGIWAVTGAAFFWPIFPLLGWGIGGAFNAWDFYRPPISEDRIRREMDRLG